MSDSLREFVVAAILTGGIQVPYLGENGASVLTFVRSALEVEVRRPETDPGRALSQRINSSLLRHVTDEGIGLIELLVRRLKPLLGTEKKLTESNERHLLSICLLYALKLKPRVSLAVMEILLPVFDAVSYIKQRDAGETFWECARLVMFATLQTFLPEESGIRADENTDESLLERLADGLAKSQALTNFFHWTPSISDPMRLVLQFGYGLLQMRYNRGRKEEFRGRLETCLKVGVFRALAQILTDRIFVESFSRGDQVICSDVVLRLLNIFCDLEHKPLTTPNNVLYRNTVYFIEKGTTNQDGDDYCSFMKCQALIFEYRPDLDPIRQADSIAEFLSWMPESKLIESSVTVLKSFVEVISGLASSEAGANRIYDEYLLTERRGLVTAATGYRHLSWDFILGAFMRLCKVLIKFEGEARHGVTIEEFQGFVMYMKLLARIFTHGPPAEALAKMERTDNEYRAILYGEKLSDILLFIFCKNVPPELKAGCAETLAAMGRVPEVAEGLLHNLRHVGLFGEVGAGNQAHPYYLSSQLFRVEAVRSDYTCTVQTFRMINALLDAAGPLPDAETAMQEATKFCKDILLDAIWKQLRFADLSQRWDLFAVAFEHFLICMERTDRDAYIRNSSLGQTSAQMVMANVMDRGSIFAAMRFCTIKYYEERSVHHFPSPSMNKAILHMLQLILAIFDFEGRADVPDTRAGISFREMFKEDREFVRKVLCSVDLSLPEDIQIAAASLVRQLYRSLPETIAAFENGTQRFLPQGFNEVFRLRTPF